MTGEDAVLSFAISYVAGKCQEWYNEKFNSIDKQIRNSFDNAISEWYDCKWYAPKYSKTDKDNMFLQDKEELISYLKGDCEDLSNESKGFLNFWASKLRRNHECYQLIIENKIDGIKSDNKEISHGINEVLNRISNLSLLIKTVSDNAQEVSNKIDSLGKWLKERDLRGTFTHNPVTGYVSRTCSVINHENDFVYLNGTKRPSTLYNFVIGTAEECKKYHYILYASAHNGKTTELNHLAWQLQETGWILPIKIELKKVKDLRTNQLPSDYVINGKMVVLIIDALDETSEEERSVFYGTINEYVDKYPEMPIIISCRTNFRREHALPNFMELSLNPLTWNDVKDIINGQLDIDGPNMIQEIEDNNLFSLSFDIYYLKIMIQCYKSKHYLPKNIIELYELAFEESYLEEKKKCILPEHQIISKQNLNILLMRMAFVMQMSNETQLHQDNVREIINQENELVEIRRFGILEEDDELFFFKDNFIKEYFAAKVLSTFSIEDVKSFCCFKNTNRIATHWYNTIFLYISYRIYKEKNLAEEIKDWLLGDNKDLFVHIDTYFVDENTRKEIFKSILTRYKDLGIYYSYAFSPEYESLMKFGDFDEVHEWLVNELKNAEVDSPYLYNILCLIFNINWNRLKEEIAVKIDESYYYQLEENSKLDKIKYTLFILNGAQQYQTKEHLDKIISIFFNSHSHIVITETINLISKLDVVDEYLDYILDNEKYVHNIHEGNTTHIISRHEIYDALGKVKRIDNIQKILLQSNKLEQYGMDEDEHHKMVVKLLNTTLSFCTPQNDIRDFLREYCKQFITHIPYGHDDKTQEIISLLRDCYFTYGNNNSDYNDFMSNIYPLFVNNEGIQDFTVFHPLNLWMTDDVLISIYSKLDDNNQNDKIFASWFNGIAFSPLHNLAISLYRQKFHEENREDTWLKKRQDGFNNYCIQYHDDPVRFVQKIASEMFNEESQIKISDENKNLAINYAKECILSPKEKEKILISLSYKMLIHGYFSVDEDALLNLIDYADICDNYNIDYNYESEYYLLNFVAKQIGREIVEKTLLEKMRNNGNVVPAVFERWATYIIASKLSGCYVYVHHFLNNSKDCSSVYNIIDLMIKNNCEIDILVNEAEQWSVDVMLFLARNLHNIQKYNEKFLHVISSKYLSYNEYNKKNAIALLLLMGYIPALEHITENWDLCLKSSGYVFRFSTIDALPYLSKCLVHLYDEREYGNTSVLSILESIKNIAMQSPENFAEVKKCYEEILSTEKHFQWLNRQIIECEKIMYENNNYKYSIKDATEWAKIIV